MGYLEILGGFFFISAIVLLVIAFFIPQKNLVKVKLELLPTSIAERDGYRGKFKIVILGAPFWMLNTYGKSLRVSICSLAFVGLVVLNISYWIG
jgi:hypothetical protein